MTLNYRHENKDCAGLRIIRIQYHRSRNAKHPSSHIYRTDV